MTVLAASAATEAPTPATGGGRPWRALLLRLHLLAGLLVGPFVLVAALSGGAYAVATPVERLVHQDVLRVEPRAASLPLADQVRRAQDASGVAGLVAVRPAPSPSDSTRVLFDDSALPESTLHAVFVDPGSGRVLGQERVYGTSGSLPLRTWVDQAHRSLHLGAAGRTYSEVAASWLWLVALGGLGLWLTGRRRRRRDLALPRGGATGRSSARSWHAVVGVWTLLGALALSATGLTWSRWAGAGVAELRASAGWSAPAVQTQLSGAAAAHAGADHHATGAAARAEPAPTDVADVDAVVAAARAAGLRSAELEVRFPLDREHAWTATEVQRRFPTRADAAAVDPATLRVLDVVRFAEHPFPAKLARWGVDLHMGTLFGAANQVALVLLSLGLAALVLLGHRTWWLRRPRTGGLPPVPARPRWRELPRPLLLVLVLAGAGLAWALPVLGVTLLLLLGVDALLARRPRRPRDTPPAQDTPAAPRLPTAALLALSLAVATPTAVAVVAVALLVSGRPPGEGSPEVAFARDMQAHHHQAVQMAALAQARTTDPEVLVLATDILTSQQAQIGMMSGWLQAWGLPVSAPPTGAGHDGDHGHGHEQMQGMASAAELRQLSGLRGQAFDVLFARLMHAHHEGALPMADAVLARSEEPAVRSLARSIRDSQAAELEVLARIAAGG